MHIYKKFANGELSHFVGAFLIKKYLYVADKINGQDTI